MTPDLLSYMKRPVLARPKTNYSAAGLGVTPRVFGDKSPAPNPIEELQQLENARNANVPAQQGLVYKGPEPIAGSLFRQQAPISLDQPASGTPGAGSPAAGFVDKLKGAGNAALTFIKNNKDPEVTGADRMNRALGAAGLISYATAKKPKFLARPGQMESGVAVQDYADFRQNANNAITDQTAGAMRQVNNMAGAGIGAMLAGTQALQANANNARTGVAAKIAEFKRNDANQAMQVKNQDRATNIAANNRWEEQRYQADTNDFNQRRQQAGAMVQGALTYETQRGAGVRQDKQSQLDREYRNDEYTMKQLLTRMAQDGLDPTTKAKLQADYNALESRYRQQVPAGRQGMKIFKRGGSVDTQSKYREQEFKSETQHKNNKAKAEAQFRQQLNRITLQAMKNFSQSISQSYKRK